MDLSKSPLSKNVEDRRSPEGREGDAWNALMMELLKGQPVPTEYIKGDRIKGDREEFVPEVLGRFRRMEPIEPRSNSAKKGDKESAMPAMDPARAAMLAAIDPESFVENFIIPAGAGAPPPPAAATGGDEMAQGGNWDWAQPGSLRRYLAPDSQSVFDYLGNADWAQPGSLRRAVLGENSPNALDALGLGGGQPTGAPAGPQGPGQFYPPGATPVPGQAAPPMDTAPLGQAPGPRGMGGGYGPMGASNLPPRPTPGTTDFSYAPAGPQVGPRPGGQQLGVETAAPPVPSTIPPGPWMAPSNPGQMTAQPQTQTLDSSKPIAPQIKTALAAGRPAMPSGAPVPLPQPKPEVPGVPGTGVTAGNVASALTGVSDMLGDSKPPVSAGYQGTRPVDNGNALYELMARLGLNPAPGARPVSPYAGRR